MPDERREEPEGLAERGERLLDADSDRTGDGEEGDDEEVFSAVLSRRSDWRGWSVLSPSEVMVRLRVDVMLVPNRIYRMISLLPVFYEKRDSRPADWIVV